VFNHRRSTNLVLLAVSATALVAGMLAYGTGRPGWAGWLWVGGAVPVLVALLVGMTGAILRRESGLDVLALLAMSGAMILGEHLTAAVIALMFASGRTLEDYAEARAQREMSALLSHAPRTATRYKNGQLVPLSLESVRPGDRLFVRAGEVVPVDGSLVGNAELDASTLTGESLMVRRSPGSVVQSGVVNAGAPFDIIATSTSAESTFAGIIRLVESAQQSRAPAARLADRYALLFVPLALGMAGIAWLAAGDPMRALAVLVVATPCPLILAVPMAIVAGMSTCAKRGILVKSGGALETLAQTQTLFFDKTGTLTGGHARLVGIEAGQQTTPTDVLRLAASLDQASKHVIAEAVVTAARERGLSLSTPQQVEETPGAGLRGIVDGRQVALGTFAYVSTTAVPAPWSHHFLQQLGYEDASGVFVSVDGTMVGALQMSDEIRLETPRALRILHLAGVRRIVMLTGDRRDVAETIGAALGVNEVIAEQSPSGKCAAIEAARAQGPTIMVGDGVNDAPALAAADVGVAMGARGAAASSEAADVVLMVDRLDRLAEALQIATRSRAIAVQSVVAGMGLSMAAMLAAACGYVPPLIGAVLQEAIDVAVVLNALRALRVIPAHRHGTLTHNEVDRLTSEHAALGPVLDRIRSLAERLAILPRPAIRAELVELVRRLRECLLPHERHDDAVVYPVVAQLLGGDDPMAAMSTMHREILRLTRLLEHMAADLPPDGRDPAALGAFQRVLYGLEAILRLHFAQEEEIYYTLGDTG
jgi:heavy metal translocating P-type ATPase